MGSSSYYSQRNPEGLLARSNSDNYGALRGKVLTQSGNFARYKRISGVTKATDVNYGASYTYYLMTNGAAFPDEAAYGINYYIARITTGYKTLNFDNGAVTKSVTVSANTDSLVSNTVLPY